jgi:hypothetical protein
VLPCQFDSRTRLSNAILETMKSSENLGPLVFDTVIRKNVRLAEIAGTGKSIFKSASSSFGAEDYDKLADEVIQRTGMEIREIQGNIHQDTQSGQEHNTENLVGVNVSSDDSAPDTQDSPEEPVYHQQSYDSGTGENSKSGEN